MNFLKKDKFYHQLATNVINSGQRLDEQIYKFINIAIVFYFHSAIAIGTHHLRIIDVDHS